LIECKVKELLASLDAQAAAASVPPKKGF